MDDPAYTVYKNRGLGRPHNIPTGAFDWQKEPGNQTKTPWEKDPAESPYTGLPHQESRKRQEKTGLCVVAVLQRARAWEQIGCDAFHELEARPVPSLCREDTGKDNAFRVARENVCRFKCKIILSKVSCPPS